MNAIGFRAISQKSAALSHHAITMAKRPRY
jgi:hypothetical protein